MDGLKGPRATWMAALGTGLSALHGLINVLLSAKAADWSFVSAEQFALFAISVASVLSSLIWCWLFVVLYREERSLANKISLRAVIMIALLFVLLPRALVLGLQAYSSILFDTIGIFTIVVAALAILLWAWLLWIIRAGLIKLDFNASRIEAIAFFLAIVIICQSLPAINAMVSGLMSMVKGSLAAAWHAGELGTMLWRQAVTPVVNLFYWVAQLMFVLALREEPRAVLPRANGGNDADSAGSFSPRITGYLD